MVAKKVVRLSVERNYMKRVIRSLFRQQQTELNAQLAQGVDLVVRANKRFTRNEYALVQAEWSSLIQKIQRRIPQK